MNGFDTTLDRSGRRGALAVGLLLLAGAAARLYGAWASRYITDPDCGVVALMAKHMAEGREWPVFFYGQAYMGSLEPALGALFCRIFGPNGFAVSLGPALCAILALPFLYLWTRDAAGRVGGVAALLFCLVGPHAYFMFQFAPRGGYMLTLLLEIVILWLAGRMAARLRRRERVGPGLFFLLGLLAGLGWWTNQIILSALLTAALILAWGMRFRLFSAGTAAGAAGFLLGSAPFWLWNATHDWASFAMLDSVGVGGWRMGTRHFINRYMRLIGLTDMPAGVRLGVAVLCAGVVASGALSPAWLAVRRRRVPEGAVPIATALVFCAISFLFFVHSSYAAMNTARYLVPLVPAAALLAGVATRMLAARVGVPAAFVPVALLFASHLPALHELHVRSAATGTRRAADRELGAYLALRGVDTVYNHFRYYPLNFNLEERCRFTDLRGDRYAPIAQGAELSDRIAVLNNHGPLGEFIVTGGGRAAIANVGAFRLDYRIHAPEDQLREIEPGRWLSAVSDDGAGDLRGTVADRGVESWWTGSCGDGAQKIEVRFRQPERVRMIRMLCPGELSYPDYATVLVRDTATAKWRRAVAEYPVTDFFWSGPRPFWGGRRFRLEYRLQGEPVEAVRIVCTRRRGGAIGRWRISELQCFEDDGAPAEGAAQAAIARLCDVLREHGVRRLYADRWESNRVHVESGGTVEVELEAKVFPQSTLARGGRVDWSADAAVVVRAHDAGVTRRTLASNRVAVTETNVGPWVVFLSPAAAPSPPRMPLPIYWSGYACLDGNSREYVQHLLARGRARLAEGDRAGAVEYLLAAVDLRPSSITAAADMLDRLAGEAGSTGRDLQALYKAGAVPEHPAAARFPGGIMLVGVTVEPASAPPGSPVVISCYWRCAEGASLADRLVFVHVRRDGIVFQADHALLEEHEEGLGADLDANEVLREDRRVNVPADAPAGSYDLQIGLYHRQTGRRLRPRTELPVSHRALVLKKIFEIESIERKP